MSHPLLRSVWRIAEVEVTQKVAFVHGIGDHSQGYSSDWRTGFNRFLLLSDDDYVEVVWESVFEKTPRRTRGPSSHIQPSALDLQTETAIRAELLATLTARSSALEVVEATEAAAGDIDPLQATRRTRGLMDWLLNPEEYLGDFVRYLASPDVRTRVRAAFKDIVGPLAGDNPIAIISHSWGTVIAYESLIDLVQEQPNLKVRSFVTLGSPLWLVRHLLEHRSGGKPANVDQWMNITARGDRVGGWLEPDFEVDKDLVVPSVRGIGPHSSYFVPENVTVQGDLIASLVLGRFAIAS